MSLEDFDSFQCPYCGETNELFVDVSGGAHQKLLLDCEVCCAPIIVRLELQDGMVVSLDVQRENE